MRSTVTLAILGFALGSWNTALAQADMTNADSHASLKSAAPKSSLSSLRSSNAETMAKIDAHALKKTNGRTHFSNLKSAQKEVQRAGGPIPAERADLAVKKAFASSADAKGMVKGLRGPSGLSNTMPSGTATRFEKDKELIHRFR
jgi:hypothetical protein